MAVETLTLRLRNSYFVEIFYDAFLIRVKIISDMAEHCKKRTYYLRIKLCIPWLCQTKRL
jgi:hypothetical protein